MLKQYKRIDHIPAVLWGGAADKLFIAVHGNMSHKEDAVMVTFAEAATAAHYQVISFDLPQHGERQNEAALCKAPNCLPDLAAVMRYAKSLSQDISIFACSMGAYFALLAYKDEALRQSIFLSPVVDMGRVIVDMMRSLNISEAKLEAEKEIEIPFGPTLYWDYYCYVQTHPINTWPVPTAILYGGADNICDFEAISSFAKQFGCNLRVLEHGEHYFHTTEQLESFKEWLEKFL